MVSACRASTQFHRRPFSSPGIIAATTAANGSKCRVLLSRWLRSVSDEFDRITEGMNTPDPELEGAAMAAKQVGMFYLALKQFNIPDAQAEWLTARWMELSGDG